jgi:cephalosporin-C deacetylase-like acetyl esterase
LLLGSATLFPPAAVAQEESTNLLDRWLIWSDPGTMVVRHLTNQVEAQLDLRAETIARLRTKEDWLARQRHVSATMERVVGTLPQRESALNPRITGVVRKDGYRIEKVIYESMPKLYVAGILLIPDGVAGRAPTILYTAGSGIRTFRGEQYQQHILNLVRNGFIVFAIDPIGQGERIQYFDPSTGESRVGEFNHTAHQCFLIGTSYAKYYIRDAMRAIDYLETRPEVDPKRIGMGGLSWGGFQCTIASALDNRIVANAPAAGCSVGIRRWFQSIGPTSAGQHYPGFVSAGLDHADFFELNAPRAVLRMSTTRDYKVIQGSRETYAEYRRAFEALGALDKVDFTEDDSGHGYTPKNNAAAYRFYGKNLSHSGPMDFQPAVLMTEKDTKITPTGQVVTSFADAARAFDFNQAEALPLLERLKESRTTGAPHLAAVRREAGRLAGVQRPRDDARPVFLGRHQRSGHALEMFVLPGEDGYVIPLLLFVPAGGGSRSAIIYVHPDGKAAAARAGGDVERLVRQGYIVAVPDVAGTGETKNRRGDFRSLQYIAMMIERSVVGLQAGDVMRVRAFLQSRPERHEVGRIGVVGVGDLGTAVLHAAALDSELSGVVLSEPSLSYRSVVMNGLYGMNLSEMVASALTAYDLPDLVACLAPRRVALLAPRNHWRVRASAAVAEEELAFPREVFSRTGAAPSLRLTPEGADVATMIDWALQ